MHSVELHNLYSSPNIIRLIKSRRMRWGGHVAHMEEMKDVYTILVGKPEEKRPLGRLDTDGRMLLKWVLRKYLGGFGLDLCDLSRDYTEATTCNMPHAARSVACLILLHVDAYNVQHNVACLETVCIKASDLFDSVRS
jgi:hypothetical protein